mmetsp:Transcript_5771/g.19637  ORF Transcript_5771/g.19637 Transcript_5771/m.19637 type:complete len:339 (-) Transcript_5771:67-1083(-)
MRSRQQGEEGSRGKKKGRCSSLALFTSGNKACGPWYTKHFTAGLGWYARAHCCGPFYHFTAGLGWYARAHCCGPLYLKPSSKRGLGLGCSETTMIPFKRMYAKSIQSHYYGNMTTSQFCLAPPGMRGGWGRRTTLVATFGCIPLVVEDNRVQPFEDIYDPDSYTVRVLEKDVDSIGELVDSISEEKISAMRRTIDCLIPKWMWSSMHGAMPTAASRMTDADDVFGALMLLLRRRIAGATGFVDPCKPIDGGALPRELCIKDNSRHISRSVPANELPRGIIPCSDADVARVGAWEDALNDAGVVSGDKGQRGGARIHQILKMQPGGASCVGLNPPGPPC